MYLLRSLLDRALCARGFRCTYAEGLTVEYRYALFEQRSKSRVQDLLASGKGSVRDKLRLLGVYCLAARPSAAEAAELAELLRQSAASSGDAAAELATERGLGAIGYLRQQVDVCMALANGGLA